MRQLAKLWRLPRAEKLLLLHSWTLLGLTRVGMWVLPFRWVRAGLDRYGSKGTVAGLYRMRAERIAWAVRVTAQYVPATRRSCLVRALAGHALLRRRGHPAELRLGATRDPDGGFHAHAWVTSDGQVLIGAREAEHFEPLVGPSEDDSAGDDPRVPER